MRTEGRGAPGRAATPAGVVAGIGGCVSGCAGVWSGGRWEDQMLHELDSPVDALG